MVKTILKSDRKSPSYSLTNLVTPERNVLRKIALKFTKIAYNNAPISKKKYFINKKD